MNNSGKTRLLEKAQYDRNQYYGRNQYEAGYKAGVQQMRQHGHWVEDERGNIKCSNCNLYLYPLGIRVLKMTDICRRLKVSFCPECGAIMEEVSEDENI